MTQNLHGVQCLSAQLWHATGADLGESPRWDSIRKQVFWIDINAGVLWSAALNGIAATSLQLKAPLGAIAVGVDVVAFAVGAQWYTLQNDVVTTQSWGTLPAQGMRFNDCAVDAAGCLWSATMRSDEVLDGTPLGAVYQCSKSGVKKKMTGLQAGNAMGWSPDGSHLYLVDSGANAVLKIPFDSHAAQLGTPVSWLQCSEGLADGLAVDSEGGVWLALWGLGQVRRYDAQAQLSWIVEVPTPQVTALCFAGDDLRTVIITTAAMGLPSQPGSSAGNTYMVRSPVAGQTVALWNPDA